MINFITVIIFLSFICGSLVAGDSVRYWIFFKDKDPEHVSFADKKTESYATARSLKRRELRAKAKDRLQTDLPVSGAYLARLDSAGVTVHHVSRWLNAVSCYLNGLRPEKLEKLAFIKEVRPVKSYKRIWPAGSSGGDLRKGIHTDYGNSFNQNNQIGIPAAHAQGYHGQDVLIAVFDTGFRLEHEVFSDLQVLAAWDFVNNDGTVSDESGDLNGQHNHGTQVLAVLAGYRPGQIIGPAYAAEFLLAKTEDLKSETHAEEDNWIAAAEWAERLGADVISSSLNYLLDYTYADMDGSTTLITRAAEIAVEKGMAVFSSAGNEGTSSWNYIAAPADGKSVIAVGGVRTDGSAWATSSIGPTSDGRIKPDLMAQGQSVFTVNPATTNDYLTNNGTSFSCALGAGAGAIILSALPGLSPPDLKRILIEHASQSSSPDNIFGYGIIDLASVLAEILKNPGVSVKSFSAQPGPGKNTLSWISNREIENDKWLIRRARIGEDLRTIASLDGRKNGTDAEKYIFTDFDVEGAEVFMYQILAQLVSGEEVLVDSARVESLDPQGFKLLTISPNPFNQQTRITFSLDSRQKLSLKIFNIKGQLIKKLIDNQYYEPQFHHLLWNATNDAGESIASGLYFLQLLSEQDVLVSRVFYLK